MSAIVKKSLVDQIYEQLKHEIINQDLVWGEKLNVNELQERFEISCTPIREAINRLQKEGFVEYKNNVGARVIDIKEKDVVEIQEVALTLDCAAIKYAIRNEDINSLCEELLNQINRYKVAEDEFTRSNCTEEFSNILYKYADNEKLSSVAKPIKGLQGMLKSTYRKEKKQLSNMEEHVAIYNAIKNKDFLAAVEAMEENYKKGTELLVKVFEDKKEK
ncbi:GntR family transcriptional regulator [Clostridium intestinale]|uniref:GntR family transcriptional regulator n=1 Tax=Clostridium intestinale TaxID=36845 RepID=UPI002DD64E92|nr:GntR family transcriptional regulator [Clostridium intestinale]WRY51374.1 GntR family transcriptional regulator [Clostridium intestinale]